MLLFPGRLVSDFLCEDVGPMDYCTKLSGEAQSYNGYAFLAADFGYVRCDKLNEGDR